MRPIEINSYIKSKICSFVLDELKKPMSSLSIAKNNIIALKSTYLSTANEYKVLEEIISDFSGFICKSPEEHELLINEWHLIEPNIFYNPSKSGKNKSTDFGQSILSALNYNKFRSNYAHIIIKLSGQKVCPYCNASLTVVSGKNNKSRFQLDHFFPKKEYPLLSISFYNLIPSCANCNLAKSSNSVKLGDNFHLYSSKTPKEGFRFEITKDSFVNYWVKNNSDNIKIVIKNGKDSNLNYTNTHNKTFGILDLYNTQKDIVEELFWKTKAYNETRIKELSKMLDIDEVLIKRMVIGNYIDKEDIHKRPLAKFQQDIARQLNLIK